MLYGPIQLYGNMKCQSPALNGMREKTSSIKRSMVCRLKTLKTPLMTPNALLFEISIMNKGRSGSSVSEWLRAMC